MLDTATHEVKTPPASRRRTRSTSRAAGRRSAPTRRRRPGLAARREPVPVTRCSTRPTRRGRCTRASRTAPTSACTYGTDEQKQLLPAKLTSGDWTGTMCLTEPHAAPTSACCAPRPSPQADGSYRLTGNKIFISAGEHDMADNIVHLVLARLPDAPTGIERDLAVRGAEVRREGQWTLERAERHLGARPRAQDGHPRQRDLPDRLSTAPAARWSASPTRAGARCS